MLPTSRMKSVLFLLPLIVAACAKPTPPAPFNVAEKKPRSDKAAPFDPPNMYPDWAYDQPSYKVWRRRGISGP
jgi:hypothetical protein